MTAATTPLGLVIFGVVMAAFMMQEFTRGFGTPADGEVRDDRSALIYLEVLPVVLVIAAFGVSLGGWLAWPSSWPVLVVGLVFMLAGLGVREWSHRTLGPFHRALVTIQGDHELVTGGPYRFVRHPMYAGSALTFLGIGLVLGTVPALVVAFVGTLHAMIRRIQVEERALEGALGERYREYAASRPRLVPGLW